MNIFSKETPELDEFIVNDRSNGEEDVLQFLISQDNIANCFGYLLDKKDVEELRNTLTDWLYKN